MTTLKTALPARSDIPKEYTWNAESVFPIRADWEAAAKSIIADLPSVAQYKGRLAEGALVLADYMDAADKLMRLLGKVYVYASMSSAVDTADTEAMSMLGQAGGLYGQALAAISFSDPELLAIGRETLEGWVKAEPRLAIYGQYVDNLFRLQAHVRSAEVEEVMGLASDPMDSVYTTYSQLANADLKFAPVNVGGQTYEVAQGSINTLLDNPDREVRRQGWENYADGYLGFKNTIAANYAASLKMDVFRARVRGYGSSLEASLYNDNVPQAVFRNLMDTFKRNLPTWHKYWAVKRRVMGYDSLHTYDVWAPMVKDEPGVPYPKAVDWICEGLKPLGDDYVSAMRRGCLQDRWVDVYPNQGKRQGAFSSGVHDTFPFIMMSYDDNLGAMSTLAHELGHSMHSYLARKNQPAAYSGYTLFVAEVASNFNQAMTRAHLMRQYPDDRTLQIALIQEAMSNFHRYFFIMPTLARFELEMHERVEQGRGVTSQDMNALMADLYAEGYGDTMTLDRERDGITWATFGHLYSAFYVYQYATGISAAHALSEQILAGDTDAAKRYVEFLSMGSSQYPLDALKHAGVDMTSPEAVETTFGVLARYVDRLDELTQ
ncbi:MAG: oligoendopeptidase F [Anaerolineae bacterium]|nr:oligoendopeptidase F [Anaerolineae bacterium]